MYPIHSLLVTCVKGFRYAVWEQKHDPEYTTLKIGLGFVAPSLEDSTHSGTSILSESDLCPGECPLAIQVSFVGRFLNYVCCQTSILVIMLFSISFPVMFFKFKYKIQKKVLSNT